MDVGPDIVGEVDPHLHQIAKAERLDEVVGQTDPASGSRDHRVRLQHAHEGVEPRRVEPKIARQDIQGRRSPVVKPIEQSKFKGGL